MDRKANQTSNYENTQYLIIDNRDNWTRTIVISRNKIRKPTE